MESSMKYQTTEPQAKDEVQSIQPSHSGIISVSSQDSAQTAGSVASRRKRIMAIQAKNKASRRSYHIPKTISSPKVGDADADSIESNNRLNNNAKGRSWQSPQPKNSARFVRPEPIETQQIGNGEFANNAHRSPNVSSSSFAMSPSESSMYQSNKMEHDDEKEQQTRAVGRTSINSKSGISDKIRNFQRDLRMSSSKDDRASTPPPPLQLTETQSPVSQARDAERSNKFKSWSERDQKERRHDNRVVAFPSPTSWRASMGSPPSGQQHMRGSRIIIPRSPTASVCSVDSSFSAQQSKQQSSTASGNNKNKQSWNNSSRLHIRSKSPEIQRTFSSTKYGSPQAVYSNGKKKPTESPVFMYKNLLKPVQKETEVQESHEKEAYGAIIETPKKSSVSNLHAMFDSQDAQPLMPMNSNNSSVRQSQYLPSPSTPSSVKSGGSSRNRSFTGMSPSQTPSPRNKNSTQSRPVSADGKSRVRQYYNASWRMESPVQMHQNASQGTSHDESYWKKDGEDFNPTNLRNSWQQRCKPQANALPPANVASLMYSEKRKLTKVDPDIDVKTRKTIEPSGAPQSAASSSSLMHSQNNRKIDETDVMVSGNEVKGQKNVETIPLSASAIASFMYSQNTNIEDKLNKDTAMEWPSDTNERKAFSETVTDVILDSITDVNPSDIELSARNNATDKDDKITLTTKEHPSKEHSLESVKTQEGTPTPVKTYFPNEASTQAKPWEKDTKSSVVQSWQKRSSKSKDPTDSAPSNPKRMEQTSEDEAKDVIATTFVDGDSESKLEKNSSDVTNGTNIESESLATKPSSDSYIEEKKSSDLSFDEDEILGQDVDGRPSPKKVSHVEAPQHGDQSIHPQRMPFYDDDSYLSRGDTDARELGASESILTTSGRSRTIGTNNSEDMSVYVEDERIGSIKDEKMLSAQFEQMNLEAAVGASELKFEEKKEEIIAQEETIAPKQTIAKEQIIEQEETSGAPEQTPALTMNVDSSVRPNLPRLNPSPKDCDEYRNKFFEESGGVRDVRRKKIGDGDGGNKDGKPISAKDDVDSVQGNKLVENQVFDIWVSASHEERDEAIKFDETEEWLNRDPDIEDTVAVDDASASSEVENADKNIVKDNAKSDTESRPILLKKPPQSYRTPEIQKQRTKIMNNSAKRAVKEQPQQDVFDPFGFDAEEHGLTVETSEDLFSSNPDPFMIEESFSPLEWSAPDGSNASNEVGKSNSHSQHIGYYNSPDSRVEI